MSGNLSKSAFFEGVGLLWAQIWDGRGRRPPTTVGVRKLEWLPFRGYQNICSALFGFVTKHGCDRQRDGQNNDSKDRASIAASRDKNK